MPSIPYIVVPASSLIGAEDNPQRPHIAGHEAASAPLDQHFGQQHFPRLLRDASEFSLDYLISVLQASELPAYSRVNNAVSGRQDRDLLVKLPAHRLFPRSAFSWAIAGITPIVERIAFQVCKASFLHELRHEIRNAMIWPPASQPRSALRRGQPMPQWCTASIPWALHCAWPAVSVVHPGCV
jgi:hypothetical protein